MHTWNADRLTLARYITASVVTSIKHTANCNALTHETPAFMRTISRSTLQLISFHLSCLIQDQTTQVTFYSFNIITEKQLSIRAGENNDALSSGTGELNLLARFSRFPYHFKQRSTDGVKRTRPVSASCVNNCTLVSLF
jgi:hypothetical protein